MGDSKELWLAIDKEIESNQVVLGRYASEEYINDPIHLAIVASRYKFCARMLKNKNIVMEVGCGDGFGSSIVARSVKKLICTDINDMLMVENQKRNHFLENVNYCYFDFRKDQYTEKVDGIYLIDVIEHIYAEEELDFVNNLSRSLTDEGVIIVGTPNISAKQYSGECSKRAHVNLKSYDTLYSLMKKFFKNVFIFGMNDEVLHTGYSEMCHFLFALCAGPKRGEGD